MHTFPTRDTVTLTIHVPESVMQALRSKAGERNESISRIIINVLVEWAEKQTARVG